MSEACACLALPSTCALAQVRSHFGGLCVSMVSLCSQRPVLTHATASWLKSKNSIHPFIIFHQLMEPIHAELVRLATELEAVRGQVQTECNALRDLFARTTAPMSGSQHDRRLNHREAERHLPKQFGPVVSTMETLHFEWKVMQRSCQAMDRVVRC